MAASPLITFKAGQCELDTESKPYKVKPQEERGYISLYSDDDLLHFCWRKRSQTLEEADVDLVMVPGDGTTFVPYESSESSAKTNGRVFVLKFGGSPDRYLFWLQSKPQGSSPSTFSDRDRKIGGMVNSLLQGEEIDVQGELQSIRNNPDDRDDDDDEDMEEADAQPQRRQPPSGSGGAGAGATGGDIRDEGEESREGGSDGARA